MVAGECWIFDTWRRHCVLNHSDDTRIHLVADTVGGERFWDLLSQGRTPEQREPEWQPKRVDPRAAHAVPALDFESFNVPVVMSPWELREHIVFLINDAEPAPQLAAKSRCSDLPDAGMRFGRAMVPSLMASPVIENCWNGPSKILPARE